MYLINCWIGRQIDLGSMRNYWQAGRVGLNQFNFNYNYHDNPYFNLYENTNGQEMDRLYGNIAATYQFNNWLSLMARVGTDYSDEFRDRRRAFSTQRYPLGSYREEQVFLQETNADFLLSFNKDLNQDLSLAVSVGGNAMRRRYNLSDISAPQLTAPGIFSLNNSRVPLNTIHSAPRKELTACIPLLKLDLKIICFLN